MNYNKVNTYQLYKVHNIFITVLSRYKALISFFRCPRKIIAVFFIGFIFIFGGLTILLNFKAIAYQTFIGYKEELTNLPSTVDHIRGMANAMESFFSNKIFADNIFVSTHGLLQKIMLKKVVDDVEQSNTIVKDDNGKLHFVKSNKSAVSEYIQSMLKLKLHLKDRNTDILYNQAPCKVINGYTQLPIGINDFTNQAADDFISGLMQFKIDYFDLRQNVVKNEIDKNKLFYKTDHHWTTETAFLCFTKVVDKLNYDYNFEIEEFYADSSNYNKVLFKNSFLGSQGKRVGRYYGGLDDYVLITPNFDTNFTIVFEYSSDKFDKLEGNFYDTFIKEEFLDQSKSIYTNRYCAYLGGDYPFIRVTNNDSKNDKKILLVKDSFADNFIPFLSLSVKSLDVMDLRLFKQQTLKQFLDNNKYDLVMYLYNPGAFFENEQLFNFGW